MIGSIVKFSVSLAGVAASLTCNKPDWASTSRFLERSELQVTDFKPKLDLLETRRQLVAMRSLHSHNRRVANEINKLIRKIAHLHQPG